MNWGKRERKNDYPIVSQNVDVEDFSDFFGGVAEERMTRHYASIIDENGNISYFGLDSFGRLKYLVAVRDVASTWQDTFLFRSSSEIAIICQLFETSEME